MTKWSETAKPLLLRKSNTVSFILGTFIGLSVIQFNIIDNVTVSILSGGIFYIIQEML